MKKSKLLLKIEKEIQEHPNNVIEIITQNEKKLKEIINYFSTNTRQYNYEIRPKTILSEKTIPKYVIHILKYSKKE